MKTLKKHIISSIMLIPILFLCGCYDSREIDESAYLIALGVDKGETAKFVYTFQIASPLSITGGDEGEGQDSGNPGVINIAVDADDFYVAKSLVNSNMNKTVDMSHLKMIVFSDRVEKDDFLNHSQLFLHERQVRPHTSVAVSEQSAREYLEYVKPTLEANTAKYYELASIRSNNIFYPIKTLSDFVDQLDGVSKASALPIAHSKESSTEDKESPPSTGWISADNTLSHSDGSRLYKTAVFKNGESKGKLGNDYTMIFNMLNKNIETFTVTLENPHDKNTAIVFRITALQAARYKTDIEKKPCSITVSQTLGAEFLGGYLPKGFNNFDALYSYGENVLFQKVNDFFYHLSRTEKADIMNIGAKLDKTLAKPLSPENWDKLYTNANFDIKIRLKYSK